MTSGLIDVTAAEVLQLHDRVLRLTFETGEVRDVDVVEVLTSDPGDLSALAGHAEATIALQTSMVHPYQGSSVTLSHMRGLPASIAAADPRVVRPRDARAQYRNPAKELAALASAGVLQRVAHGYYVIVPERARALGGWRPEVEAVALAIAQVDYGRDGAALMGLSAARVLGAVPRGLGAAIVAVPVRRPTLETSVGAVHFVTRTIASLDVERTTTTLAEGWVTTVEQTLVDLLDRPDLAEMPRGQVQEAAWVLAAQADADVVGVIGTRMRKRTAASHALELIERTTRP